MLKYWLWLTGIKGLGSVTAMKLLDNFGSPRDVYFTPVSAMKDMGILKARELDAIADKSLEKADKILEDCESQNIQIITIQDSQYPERLKNIYDPPLVLYVKGKLPAIDDEVAVAMVGSRKASVYGLVTAERLACEITEHGGIVISGMAKGIDAAAHKGALKAGGTTIAVLGCGVDVIYPKENRRLYEDIIAAGAVVSEYPPGFGVTSGAFPRRNRIISGLSVAALIVEAGERSGALITAGLALEQGREVFAVPGNIDAANSVGCNRLIREGAGMAGCGWDVLRDFEPLFDGKLDPAPRRKHGLMSRREIIPEEKPAEPKPQAKPSLKIDMDSMSEDEKEMCKQLLDGGTMHIDDLIELTQIPAHRVLAALTMLELGGVVSQEKAKYFKIAD